MIYPEAQASTPEPKALLLELLLKLLLLQDSLSLHCTLEQLRAVPLERRRFLDVPSVQPPHVLGGDGALRRIQPHQIGVVFAQPVSLDSVSRILPLGHCCLVGLHHSFLKGFKIMSYRPDIAKNASA